jgi:hypothetical protein
MTLRPFAILAAAGLLASAADHNVVPGPRVVLPGAGSAPPSDAIVLFDGRDLSHWNSVSKKGEVSEAKWKVENGYLEVVRHTGALVSKQKFGSAQIHVEWATPAEVTRSGQERGNSGVYLMGLWEIQVLDSWENPTYPKGGAASLYGQADPLVNACRHPGEWQSYDIILTLKPEPTITVLHNGVLVHNHVAIHHGSAPVPESGPLMLQDHPGPVRFRNIWVRPL